MNGEAKSLVSLFISPKRIFDYRIAGVKSSYSCLDHGAAACRGGRTLDVQSNDQFTQNSPIICTNTNF